MDSDLYRLTLGSIGIAAILYLCRLRWLAAEIPTIEIPMGRWQTWLLGFLQMIVFVFFASEFIRLGRDDAVLGSTMGVIFDCLWAFGIAYAATPLLLRLPIFRLAQELGERRARDAERFRHG